MPISRSTFESTTPRIDQRVVHASTKHSRAILILLAKDIPSQPSPMDFTEVHQQTSNLVAFSPGAQFILTAIENRLYVRRVDTFQIARTWLVDTSPSATSAILSVSTRKVPPPATTSQEGWISHISWSQDSEYILAACVKRGVVNLFKLRDQDWDGRIECGAEGLTRAEWAPDGRSILCFSEWGVSECDRSNVYPSAYLCVIFLVTRYDLVTHNGARHVHSVS